MYHRKDEKKLRDEIISIKRKYKDNQEYITIKYRNRKGVIVRKNTWNKIYLHVSKKKGNNEKCKTIFSKKAKKNI